MTGTAPLRLQWRVEGGTEAVPLESTPCVNRGFIEGRRYLFDRPGPGFVFTVDDEPLVEGLAGHSWEWRPRFYAGQVRAELFLEGRRVDAFVLDVSPDPGKLGAEAFQQMVQELWAEDPTLVVGQEPATINAGQLGRLQDPLVEFERVRRHVPDFLRALRTISTNPRRTLRSVRGSVPLSQVRRVDRYTALAASRSAAVVLFASDQTDPVSWHSSTRLDVPVVEETLDASANRALKALTLAVLQRVRTVSVRLQQRVDREVASETRTALSTRWPTRREVLVQAEAQLLRALRQLPFPDVRRTEVSAAGLNAVSADPMYARAWGRGWRALRQGFEENATDERLWISPSWEIYERWCFMKIGRMLEAHTSGWQWHRRIGSRRWVGRSEGRKAELRLQPTFGTSERQVARRWSVSKQRVPDMALRLIDADGERFVVLDAKYRARREHVLDAMQSAHIYQDALRIGSRRPEASLLLVPANEGAAWMEAPAFHREHNVGVHVLSPGREAELPALIVDLLRER